MNIFDQIKDLNIYKMAELLGEFADTHCNTCNNHECFRNMANSKEKYFASCPIKRAGFCGYPELACNESALNWLRSETTMECLDDGEGYLRWINRDGNE